MGMGENRAQAGALKPPFSGFNQSLSWCKVNSKPKTGTAGGWTQIDVDPRPAPALYAAAALKHTKATNR